MFSKAVAHRRPSASSVANSSSKANASFRTPPLPHLGAPATPRWSSPSPFSTSSPTSSAAPATSHCPSFSLLGPAQSAAGSRSTGKRPATTPSPKQHRSSAAARRRARGPFSCGKQRSALYKNCSIATNADSSGSSVAGPSPLPPQSLSTTPPINWTTALRPPPISVSSSKRSTGCSCCAASPMAVCGGGRCRRSSRASSPKSCVARRGVCDQPGRTSTSNLFNINTLKELSSLGSSTQSVTRLEATPARTASSGPRSPACNSRVVPLKLCKDSTHAGSELKTKWINENKRSMQVLASSGQPGVRAPCPTPAPPTAAAAAEASPAAAAAEAGPPDGTAAAEAVALLLHSPIALAL
mmetsp:Transcript_108732/g.347014  ORF Transcript_108732/g.347014 Transcript_108732/m.347014 type:complete len:355 (+) Transcript_108732:3730-4794(+)